MKNACIKSLINLGKKDKRIVLISVDQFTGFEDELKKFFKNRYFMESISEANIIGMASGLASEGFIPYIFNHATFNSRRCYEQILLDSCLQNHPIRLISVGAGLATAHLGPTHTSFDDVSLMRTIPGMVVLVPYDSKEITKLMPLTIEKKKSIYIRLTKYGDPKYGNKINVKYSKQAKIGKAQIIYKNHIYKKNDVLIVANGTMTPIAAETCKLMHIKKIKCSVLNISTVKPLDHKKLYSEINNTKFVFIVEEHSIIGGLGSACIEALVDNYNLNKLPYIYRIGLPDKFIHNYGDQKSLLEMHCMMPQQLLKRILNKIKFNKLV